MRCANFAAVAKDRHRLAQLQYKSPEDRISFPFPQGRRPNYGLRRSVIKPAAT
jgi:hypothetical protein